MAGSSHQPSWSRDGSRILTSVIGDAHAAELRFIEPSTRSLLSVPGKWGVITAAQLLPDGSICWPAQSLPQGSRFRCGRSLPQAIEVV